jgi:CheY-like chemotaxis protein
MADNIKPQILVVDDEPSVRECLSLFLMSAGYEVATAENGTSAVSQLSRAVPHLIVTDLNMPQMSGIELISHVRSHHPSIPVVAMSGDYQGDAIPAGIIADRFYPKGEHPHNLLRTIASLLASNPACASKHEIRTQLKLDS